MVERVGRIARRIRAVPILVLLCLGYASCNRTSTSPDVVCLNPPARPARLPDPPLDQTCPSTEELARIDSEVTITFEGSTAEGDLICRTEDGSRDLTEGQRSLYQALVLMKSLRFDAPLPWTDRTLYDWFTMAVAGVRVRSDLPTHGCCSPARVINMMGNVNGITRWHYLELLVHEARHAEGARHTCGTNDVTIGELGAYGVQYHLLRWVGEHWHAATQVEREYTLNRAALVRASAFCRECDDVTPM